MSAVEPYFWAMRSPAARHALERCELYARIRRPLVLIGPVGSGKTTLARHVHRFSGVKGELVEVSAGELDDSLAPDRLFGHVPGAFTGAVGSRRGAFAQADGGMLFIDDLARTSAFVQDLLLRVVESRRFQPLGSTTGDEETDCRMIFASTVELNELVDRGRMTPDLCSRLGEFIVHVPALSERREDVLPLARQIAARFVEEHGGTGEVVFTEKTSALLLEYAWPWNVRELVGVAEVAATHAGVWESRVTIRPSHLPLKVREVKPDTAGPGIDTAQVDRTLRSVNGNQSETARQLGLSRNTVHKYRALANADDD